MSEVTVGQNNEEDDAACTSGRELDRVIECRLSSLFTNSCQARKDDGSILYYKYYSNKSAGTCTCALCISQPDKTVCLKILLFAFNN